MTTSGDGIGNKSSPTKLYDRRKGDLLDGMLGGKRRVNDPTTGQPVIKLFTGDWHLSLSGSDEMIVTVLGSCISACIRDPLLGIGGMNHFLIPNGSQQNNPGLATRFGVNAMEQLLNSIYKLGGRRERLEVKVFGGGNVTGNSMQIGTENVKFIRQFLADEGFSIAAEDLGGELPRRLHYYPESGRVRLRKLRRQDDLAIAKVEAQYQDKITEKPSEGDIDLF